MCSHRFLTALCHDIERERCFAERLIRQAEAMAGEYPVVRGRMARCAAAALGNAVALAQEVICLGGDPPALAAASPAKSLRRWECRGYLREAREALNHYRRRVEAAERLGMARLSEVFRTILITKQRHLAYAVFSAPDNRSGTNRPPGSCFEEPNIA